VANGRDGRAEWDGVGAAVDGQVDVSQVRAAGQGDSVPTKEVPMNGLALLLFAVLPIAEAKPYSYKENSPYYGVKAGDPGLQLSVFVTGGNGVANLIECKPVDGWRLMNAQVEGGQYPAIPEEKRPVVWVLDVPAGKTVKVNIQFHGGPDPSRAAKAAKDGKGITIWEH
jgi:hypothetical protein